MKKRSEKWSKNRGDERKLPWGVEEMREMDCQEVKKPKDRDQDEGMDGRGLGMACETSREGGEEMENICSVYLLRFGMHDYNPPTVPQAFCVSLCHSLSRPLGVSVFISVCFFFRLSLSFPYPVYLPYRNMASMALSQMLKSFRIGFRLL